MPLQDGTMIRSGDRIVELHFDNATLMSLTGTSSWNPWDMMETLDADLNELALAVSSGAVGEVAALHGVTLFAAPGRRLGFELHAVPHTLAWSLRRYFLIGLIPIYHRDGWDEFDRMRRDRWPAELWMSTAALLRRKARKNPLPERLKRSFRTSGATRVGRRARPPHKGEGGRLGTPRKGEGEIC